LVKKSELYMDEKITLKEFSEKMWVTLVDIMKKLMENKIMTWINSSLDFDTASLIGAEFWVEVKKNEAQLDMESFMSWDLQKILDLDKEAPVRLERAPVVTVMGHVDHWKTSLLDYLRKTSMAEWEAGWITQSIWASVVDYNWKKITFIDTPGHELFTSLRARWAKLTNIAVIVVAADDSVMPQTIESINHAKAAWVPIIIAITKIDKPGHKRDQIIADIAAQWLTPEEWWGDVPVIGVSSKTWEWIDKLLENILLQAEMLELRYNPNRSAVWVVLDSYKDAKQWVIASIIVLTWTLQVGNIIMAYNTYWKIKRMQNWKW
jgi:translation initiation factor IF-2